MAFLPFNAIEERRLRQRIIAFDCAGAHPSI